MKRIIIIYLLTFVFSDLVAQSDFKDGYIFISELDTIYGQIDNKSYQQNSLYCDFRKNENDSVQRYYPKDLFAYRFIDGKYYISKNIKEESKDTSYFFEYLINGELDVYFLQKDLENSYFISNDGITLNKLKYSRKIIYKDDKRMLQESNQFIGLLNYYTGEYPKLKKDIGKISIPNHKNLIKLSEKYHDLSCDGEQCIIYEKEIPRKIKFDASTSYNLTINKTFFDSQLKYPSYSAHILFQLSQRTERVYFGLGYIHDVNFFRIPLSLNYIHPKNGFSPLFSYYVDFPLLSFVQTLSAGGQYKSGGAAFFLKGNYSTAFVIKPYSMSIEVGLILDLR